MEEMGASRREICCIVVGAEEASEDSEGIKVGYKDLREQYFLTKSAA